METKIKSNSTKEHKILMGTTSINEQMRRDLDISRDEFALCKYAHYRQADPRMIMAGWCTDEKDDVAYFVGISRQALRAMIQRMEAKNLLEISGAKGWFRATEKWIDTENACKETFRRELQERKDSRKETFHGNGKKLSTESGFDGKKLSETNKVSKLDIKEKEVVERKAPQAAVTTFTPAQIDQTAVTLVEHEVFSLEAEKENTPNSAGPQKEKEPALQNAGTLEANPVPPTFQEEQQQSTYDLYKTLEAKPRSKRTAPAGNNVEAEITDPEILEFYQAISEMWAKWIDYKKREKKGTYKSAETEAVAIGGLYRKSSGNPTAAREAILYSIENTYAGIYPPKANEAKPTAPRYSPDDRPANPVTGADLLAEISKFYHANAGLWHQSLKEGNAEKWAQEKQVSTVKAFCLHQVSTGRATDTFAQLNARLQKWFEKENTMGQPAFTGAPSIVHQAPARVSAPVRYQETE